MKETETTAATPVAFSVVLAIGGIGTLIFFIHEFEAAPKATLP